MDTQVWLSLADHYIRKLKIDWQKTVRLAFNERSNPDDDKLGMQIVKVTIMWAYFPSGLLFLFSWFKENIFPLE